MHWVNLLLKYFIYLCGEDSSFFVSSMWIVQVYVFALIVTHYADLYSIISLAPQVTFARNCFTISARLVLDTPEIVDLYVIKCVESAKIWCDRKLDVPLSMDDAVELIFHS